VPFCFMSGVGILEIVCVGELSGVSAVSLVGRCCCILGCCFWVLRLAS